MAHRSDTSNRYTPNTWRETVLNGEIPGYDRGLSFPYNEEISALEEELSEFDVEVFEDSEGLRDRAKILYQQEDQDEIYTLIS